MVPVEDRPAPVKDKHYWKVLLGKSKPAPIFTNKIANETSEIFDEDSTNSDDDEEKEVVKPIFVVE